jgi:phosphoribosylformylglycinamidine synthase
VIEEPQLRILHHGELVADIPNRSLTDECPLYHRPVGTWARPEQIKVPLDPPAHVLAELQKPRDYTADLKKLLASANICSKRWVYEQYDSMVQTNTVQGPGGEAGVMRIKGTGRPGHERGLAMALAGNGRWCYLDPKLGAMHAVAEAARKVACTGATPVAATNCLNFGNPEKPEIMAQLSAAIDGIAEACTALGTPITGGNVSLYNETRGEGIYPTPVVGVVGIIEDVTKAVPAGISDEDKLVVLLGSPSSKDASDLQQELGSSEFAKEVLHDLWGRPPRLDLEREKILQNLLRDIAQAGLINSAQGVGAGGIAVALAKACVQMNAGIHANLSGLKWCSRAPSDTPDTPSDGILAESALFGEHSSMVLVSGSVRNIGTVIQLAKEPGFRQTHAEPSMRDFLAGSQSQIRIPGRKALKSTTRLICRCPS